MTTHTGPDVLTLASGVLVTLLGVLTLRYPAVTYAIRTAWKHDDATLSERGRTDQRLLGAVLVLVGVGLLLEGFV